MMKKISLVMLVALTISAAACQAPVQYAARRFYKEARGVRYDAFAAKPLLSDLSAYNRLEIEPLENQMEDKIPAELVSQLNEQVFEQVSRMKRLEVARAAQPEDERPEVAVSQSEGGTFRASDVAVAPLNFSPASLTTPAPSERESLRPMTEAASAPRTVILRGAIVDYNPGVRALRAMQIGVGREAVLTVHLWFVDGATGQELGRYVINSEVYRMPSDSRAAVSKLSKGIGELVAKLVERESSSSPKPKPQKESPTTARVTQ